MIKKVNYGYPLLSILYRYLLGLIIIFFLILLIFLNFYFIILLFLGIGVIILYSYFGLICFKINFNKKRMEVLEKMITLSSLKGDEKVLDLGSGSGICTIGFAKKIQTGKVFGIDKYTIKKGNFKERIKKFLKINFIINSIKDAKINAKIENVENKCEFIESDLTEPFKFPDEFFHLVISSQFLYCLSEKDRLNTVKEINRVLKKNGKIIFFESSYFKSWNINIVKKFFKKLGYKIDITPYNKFKKSCILYGEK